MFASPVPGLSAELFWMAAAAVSTALFWVPYVLNRIVEHGVWPALQNPNPDVAARAQWAVRAQAAHVNAVENLVVFGVLVTAVTLSGRTSELTLIAAGVYFLARLAHFIVYALGVPVLRTLAFLTGWGASMVLALVLFGVV